MRLTAGVTRGLRLAVCILLMAVAVHAAAIFAVPYLSHLDAYSRVARLGPELRLIPLNAATRELLDPMEDEAVAAAICHFDLAAGPIKLTLPASADGFSSIALHQEGGGTFFALSNSAAENGRIEIVALTPGQAVQRAAEDDQDEPSGEVRAVASRRRGFAVFRSLALLPSQREAASARVAAGQCQVAE